MKKYSIVALGLGILTCFISSPASSAPARKLSQEPQYVLACCKCYNKDGKLIGEFPGVTLGGELKSCRPLCQTLPGWGGGVGAYYGNNGMCTAPVVTEPPVIN